eukprot:Skav206610  [mRNA]  locus=scaffold1984:1698:6084:- [translate_table: standard]
MPSEMPKTPSDTPSEPGGKGRNKIVEEVILPPPGIDTPVESSDMQVSSEPSAKPAEQVQEAGQARADETQESAAPAAQPSVAPSLQEPKLGASTKAPPPQLATKPSAAPLVFGPRNEEAPPHPPPPPKARPEQPTPRVATYGELNDSFAVAHNRILRSIGPEAFANQVLNKFPLVLTNDAVKEIAYSFGFTDNLLAKPNGKRAQAQNAISSSQHVGLMLTGQNPQQQTSQAVQHQPPQATQVPVQQNGQNAQGPMTSGAAMVAAVVNGDVGQVHSAPGPNASARDNNVDDGGHQCVICLQPMDPASTTDPVEALPCSHLFHVACLRNWRVTAEIEDMTKCPLHPRPSQPVAGNGQVSDDPLEDSAEDFQFL